MFGIFNKGMLKHKLIINYLNRELSKLYLKYGDTYPDSGGCGLYMDFLNKSDYETIKAYFKCKKQVEEYMKSYVVFRRKDGVSWFERRYKS